MCLLIFWNSLFSFCCLENMNKISQWFWLWSAGIPSWWLITAIAVSMEPGRVLKSVGHRWMHLLWFYLILQCFSLHFICFCYSRIIPVSLFICLSRATLKQTILGKNSWITVLIIIFLGSCALKILFIHMYIHTARKLSPSLGKAKSLKMLKPFVQARLCESCCVFPHTAAGWFQQICLWTRRNLISSSWQWLQCSLASRRKF